MFSTSRLWSLIDVQACLIYENSAEDKFEKESSEKISINDKTEVELANISFKDNEFAIKKKSLIVLNYE